MAVKDFQPQPSATVAETSAELSGRVARQVSDILAEAERRESVRQPVRPALAYRVPAPGVCYYF